MTAHLLPSNSDFVEHIAKTIARSRFEHDALSAIHSTLGDVGRIPGEVLDQTIDSVFEVMWNGRTAQDEQQRSNYRKEARDVISAVNLKLLTSNE